MAIMPTLLLLQSDNLPPIESWRKVFRDLPAIEIDGSFSANCDAVLRPVSCCERFGCKTGARNEPDGVMYVYDSFAFGDREGVLPRYHISNALYRDEPPDIEEQIRRRIVLLKKTVLAFNVTTQTPICSVLLHCAVLANWRVFSEQQCLRGIEACHDAVHDHLLTV